jgi:DNA-binding GntR family transcriptional regulator
MIQPLAISPSLIDQVYRRVLEAITDGTLAPGQRVRQAELADSFNVSRQPISHALHLLKRQGLVEDHGRKGLRVVPLDALRVLQLYQVREVVDGLAARLGATTPVPVLVRADTEFHRNLYALSNNPAIEEMTAPLWPHLMRSMAAVLREPDYASRVWQQEHPAILRHVLAGDAALAEAAAREHAATAAGLTARYLQAADAAA